MNATVISSVVISLFLIFVILGFVFGWFRGVSKSLIRFIMVLGVGVLAFFVIPPLAEAILNLDISKMNIIIGDVQVITVKDLVTDLLRQVPFIEDLLESSPTFETFVEVLPMMLANVLLFVVFFFIFKWVSMIIYWIIAGIFFSKKKTEGKEKHGFIGAVVGALQGFIVACIVLVPVFGVVQTAEPFIVAATATEQESVENGAAFVGNVYYVDGESSEGSSPSEGGDTSGEDAQENTLQDTLSTVGKYTDELESSWVYKMLNAIGVKKLSVSMFNKLSTVEERGVEYSLMRETEAIAEAYPEIKVVMDKNFDIQDNEMLEALKGAIDDLYKSPVLSGMVKEIVPELANRWTTGSDFCGINKPEFEDTSIQALFDVLLLNLSTSTGDTVKNDVDTGVDLLVIANNAQLLKTISEDGDILELLSKEENKNLIGDIISKALESTTLRAVLPEIINVGMDFVYRALDIDPSTIDDINSDVEINWDYEKVRIENIFTNVIDIVNEIKDGAAAEPAVPALECLDFAKLGATFDNMRYSSLLAPASKQIMNALLNNANIVGSDSTVLEKFVTELNTIWDDTTISLEESFDSIGKALEIARNLKSSTGDLDLSNIGDVLTTLTENSALKDVVNEVVTTDSLKKLGLDDQTANIVNETVSNIINGNYSDESGNVLDNEVKAAEEVFNIANKVLSLDTTTNPDATVDVSNTEAESLVSSLANSTILLDTISSSDAKLNDLGIDEKLSSGSKTNILNEINKLDDTDPAKAKLLSLFGLAQ